MWIRYCRHFDQYFFVFVLFFWHMFHYIIIMSAFRRRPNFTQLSSFERGRVILVREVGLYFREIINWVYQNEAIVLKCCRAWLSKFWIQRVRGTGQQKAVVWYFFTRPKSMTTVYYRTRTVFIVFVSCNWTWLVRSRKGLDGI